MENLLKNAKGVALILSTLFFIILLRNWLFYVQITPLDTSPSLLQKIDYKFIYKLHPVIFFIRLFFLTTSFMVFYAVKNLAFKKDFSTPYHIIGSISVLIFLTGYKDQYLYDLVIYPLVTILSALYMYAIANFNYNKLEDEEIFGVSQEEKKLTYKYNITDHNGNKNVLNIHSTNQHIYVQGGSGAGKGGSIIDSTIYQSVMMNLPGAIYSYKGYNSELVKSAYLAYYHRILKNDRPKAELVLFNWTDITRSYRANPISPKYIKTPQHAATMAEVMAKSIKKKWIKEMDEWADWAISVMKSLMWKLAKDEPELCNIPFFIEILHYENIEAIINFIESNDVSKKMFRSVSLAKDGSIKQFTGILTTALSGFASLISKEFYWLLSADEINFDVTNKENPQLVIICNDEEIKSAAAPIIGSMFSIIMKQTNQDNKLPGFLSLDEIYTQYFDGLAEYSNTVRSRNVSILIGNQEISMLNDLWGVDKADNVRGACGNQFYGMAGTEKSAEVPMKMLSSKDVVNLSNNYSSESTSQGEAMKEKKVMQIRDIMGQPTGHFVGKIANGNPPYFSAQFDLFEHEDTLKTFDIPQFVLDKYTEEDLKKAIEDNFYEIQEKTHQLLKPFIPKEENSEEND